jgi:hypothetical protein
MTYRGRDTVLTLFLESLESGLPYLNTITQEKFFAINMAVEANWVSLLSLEEVMSTITMPLGSRKRFVKYEVEQSIELLDFE